MNENETQLSPDPWVAVRQAKGTCKGERGMGRLLQAQGAVCGKHGEQNVFGTTTP